MAAVIAPRIAKYSVKPFFGHQTKLNTEAWVDGSPVKLSSGKLVECTGGATDELYYSIAASQDATAADTEIDVEVLQPGSEVLMSANAATAATHVGKFCEIISPGGSGLDYWTVDVSTANAAQQTNSAVIVQSISPDYAVGELYGTLLVKFVNSKLQYQ